MNAIYLVHAVDFWPTHFQQQKTANTVTLKTGNIILPHKKTDGKLNAELSAIINVLGRLVTLASNTHDLS